MIVRAGLIHVVTQLSPVSLMCVTPVTHSYSSPPCKGDWPLSTPEISTHNGINCCYCCHPLVTHQHPCHSCVTQVTSPNSSPPGKGQRPQLLPPDWHGKYPDEWLFSYSHPDKLNPFTVHCSLQRLSGRMLVNGAEGNNMQFNSQVCMGG